MDVLSSRFQKALTQRIAEARAAKVEAIATGMFPVEEYRRQCGVVQGYGDVAQMIEEIEGEMNREKGG